MSLPFFCDAKKKQSKSFRQIRSINDCDAFAKWNSRKKKKRNENWLRISIVGASEQTIAIENQNSKSHAERLALQIAYSNPLQYLYDLSHSRSLARSLQFTVWVNAICVVEFRCCLVSVFSSEKSVRLHSHYTISGVCVRVLRVFAQAIPCECDGVCSTELSSSCWWFFDCCCFQIGCVYWRRSFVT